MSVVLNLDKSLIVLLLLLVPFQISISEAQAAQLRLSWTDNSNNEDGFNILRKTGNSGNYTTIDSVGANVTDYTDSTVSAGITYCYEVNAFNSAGQSAMTPEACGIPAATSYTLTVAKAGAGSGSVSSSPAGINGCTASCSATFSGTVQLTASPVAGSTFAGWSGGGCSGTAGCTVNLTANTAVTATFNLSSTPAPAWTFCASEGGQCNFTGTKEVRYGANGVYATKTFTNGVLCDNSVFGDPIAGVVKQCEYRNSTATPSYTLTVAKAGAGSGSVSSSPAGINGCTASCSATFSGTVQLTASPVAGSTFAGWSGGGCSGTAGCTVNLTANTAVTATFNLSSTPAPAWTFCASEGGQCNFTGTKEVRYGANGVYATKTFTNGVLCDNSVFGDPIAGVVKQCEYRNSTATPSYTLTVAKAGAGSGSVSSSPAGINGCTASCSATFSGTVQLTASPSAGSTFAGWSGGGCSGTASCTVNMTASTAVTATFNLSPVTTPAPTWTFCSLESTQCNFTGTKEVRYGINGVYVSKILTNGVFCDNSVFGDPLYGFLKQCEYRDVPTTTAAATNLASTDQLQTTANQQPSRIGIFRPSTGQWFLDRNGNGVLDCGNDLCINNFGQDGMRPVSGDWNGVGISSIGTFDINTGSWHLDNGNYSWDSCGAAEDLDLCFTSSGQQGATPVVKENSNGQINIGTYRAQVTTTVNRKQVTKFGVWLFDTDGDGKVDNCAVDLCIEGFGNSSADLPVVGDWNNNGFEKIGFFRSTTGQWYLDLNDNGQWDGSGTDRLIASFGISGDLPVAGDWAGTGGSQIGVFRPTTGEWFLDLNGNGSWDGCEIDICIGQFGQAGDFPVVGRW